MAVTATQLRGIFPTAAEDSALSSFIATAAALVSSLVAAGKFEGIDATLLGEIELYLAAHFAAVTSPSASLTSYGITAELREWYTGEFGMSLQSTRYGQTALLLDGSGTLAELVNTAKGKLPAQLRIVPQRDRLTW